MFATAETGSDTKHNLSVRSQLPESLFSVLDQAKLTLLAEVSHYQLWFPFELQNENGEFKPILGVPEIVDLNGGERSWRLNKPHDIRLQDAKGKSHNLVSLSSTGFAFQISDKRSLKRVLNERQMRIHLDDDNVIDVEYEPVRTEKDIVAARIAGVKSGRERLRKFLFNLHRDEHKNLYRNLNS